MNDKIFEFAQREDCICCITPDNGGSWVSGIFDTINYDVYGIIYDPNIATASSACVRVSYNDKTDELFIVNSHVNLPAHHFRRCVMDDLSTRHVNYYLDENDSTKKADGTDSILTGEDGDVMVEIPITYWRAEYLPDGRILYLVSLREFTGSEPHPFFYVSPDGNTLRTQYVGAFESVLCNESGIPLTTDINADEPATFVTGYKVRSIIGAKPSTNRQQNIYRIASANNGGYTQNSLFKQFLQLMMYIEGNTLDTQTSISPGYTFARTWSYIFVRTTGRTLSFGNGNGSIFYSADIDGNVAFSQIAVNSLLYRRYADGDDNGYICWRYLNDLSLVYTSLEVPTVGSVVYSDTIGTPYEYNVSSYSTVNDALKVVSFSYRGIENPYGNCWEFEDGIVIDNANKKYYFTKNCSLYSDTDYATTYTTVDFNWPTSVIWPGNWDYKTFFALSSGGSNTKYLCDLFYAISANGRYLVRGGAVNTESGAGIGYLRTDYSVGSNLVSLGHRLAC